MSEAPTHSVRRRVAIGATFMILLRLSFRAIGLVNTYILVRLLLPSDFGLVGLATLAYSVFDTLSQLSFQLAIIRMESPKRVHYDTAWTMGVLRGAAIALLIVATAPLLADFIDEPRVIQLSYVLAFLGVIGGFENVALVDFQRSLQFERIFWYQVLAKFAGVLVAIPAAFLLRNYWALICGIAASKFASLFLGYFLKPYRPRFSLAGWQDLFGFSKWLMITNVLGVIDNYCMTLTAGRVAGTPAIGIYQIAYEIGSLPASEIAAPIRDPIYAGYSSIANDLSLLRRHFLDNLALLITVITPMSVGICLMAGPLTTLLLGQKWLAAIPLIRLTAFFALFEAIGHSAGSVYMALHRQRRFVGLYSLIVAVRVPAIIAGAYLDGIYGATAALALTSVLNMVLWNGSVPAELNIAARDYLSLSWRTAVASLLMAAGVSILLEAWQSTLELVPNLVRTGVICAVGAGIHVATQYCLWFVSGMPPAAEAQLLQLVRALKFRVVATVRGALAS